jgi:DNA-binding transcriptional MerR regulator
MKMAHDDMLPAFAGTMLGQPEMDDADKSSFSIGDLAREFGVTLRALRFYEDKNLLTPERDGLTRIYSRRDRARLKLILMGKRVGFSLVEIREMLDLYDLKDGQVTQLKIARARFVEQLGNLEQQKIELDTALVELKRTIEIVSGMIAEREGKAS